MNVVTHALRGEHRLIRQALTCLEQLIDHAEDRDELCLSSALELLEFFEVYADRTHQEKEERHLFPALLETGRARLRVRVLLAEHSVERALIAAMRRDIEGAAYGDVFSRDRFIAIARRFVRSQREHAAAEDRILLPLAEKLLSQEAETRVLAGFEETEVRLLPRPVAHYAALVERAEARLCAEAAQATTTPRTAPAKRRAPSPEPSVRVQLCGEPVACL